jgi:hypothetical protein
MIQRTFLTLVCLLTISLSASARQAGASPDLQSMLNSMSKVTAPVLDLDAGAPA